MINLALSSIVVTSEVTAEIIAFKKNDIPFNYERNVNFFRHLIQRALNNKITFDYEWFYGKFIGIYIDYVRKIFDISHTLS